MFFSFYDVAFSLKNDDSGGKKHKKVSFCNTVRVLVIPSINNNTSNDELWWSKNDYISFFHSSIFEIQHLISKNPNISFTNAKKILYQPCDIPNEKSSILINE